MMSLPRAPQLSPHRLAPAAFTLLGLLLLGLVLSCLAASPAAAMDRVRMKREGIEQELVGRVIEKAEDGGLLFETREGTLWTVPPEEQLGTSNDSEPFAPYPADKLAELMLKELPPGFETYQTKHYLICFNTSRAYAQWCGSLFERLYQGFGNYWSNRGFEPRDSDRLLVAVVFADRTSYARYARRELGDGVDSIIGYYSLKTDRMTMYDLTGTAGTTGERGSAAQITQTLSRPEAFKTVATIVHEATHQIVFNCGMHRRYADIPLWLSEGMAVYFESPDLDGGNKGWRTIGKVNTPRLLAFRQYLRTRPKDSLASLLKEDARMRNPQLAGNAYAEAWALNYFLINVKAKQYQEYMQVLAKKTPLVWDTPEARLAQFEQSFGSLDALDKEFVRYMQRLK
ncbi:MAG: DUF1570 domain-containing protein [Planctomycetia bacterium]|nr:DUF1570 domain-containing protein [Planctomycetia bacterium]